MSERNSQTAEWALRERVKELTCLYGIAHVTQERGIPLGEALQAIVELLPAGWQFPEVAAARIVIDDQVFMSAGFQETSLRQAAELNIDGRSRGSVEVCYPEDLSNDVEKLFLLEERSLIDMVAREVSDYIEHSEAEEANSRLRDQLRHADRLATLGQLAAGVAHEINEPLSNILGFAQLAMKSAGVPRQASEDMEKIVKSCLHAREVIHKLLTFARQMPPAKTQVAMNQVVSDGLYFLEARCVKAGIEIARHLEPGLPDICADGSQVHQVLVNLIVNAIQAMPDGGTLTIETHSAGNSVCVAVQDTGIGMSEEIKRNIFTPFFTTKDVDQGTGLGLAVVDGIVASHGGTIKVESECGRGARFEVLLPVMASSEIA